MKLKNKAGKRRGACKVGKKNKREKTKIPTTLKLGQIANKPSSIQVLNFYFSHSAFTSLLNLMFHINSYKPDPLAV